MPPILLILLRVVFRLTGLLRRLPLQLMRRLVHVPLRLTGHKKVPETRYLYRLVVPAVTCAGTFQ